MPHSRCRLSWLVALFAVTGVVLVSCLTRAVGSSQSTPQLVTLSIDEARPGPPIPSDFLGLSYEVKDLPLVASLATKGNYVALLRSLGKGALRFGGVTADSQVAWLDPAAKPMPRWATTALVPADLYHLAALTRATGWSVVLTLNLDHFDPAVAADEARVAKLALGASLKAVEFGNEPTAYVAERLRHGRFTFAEYRREVSAYQAAIAAAVPGLAIDGPDDEPLASNPSNLRWARAEAREVRPSVLTAHLYGASKCDRIPPTPALLLSGGVHSFEETALRELEGVSRRYGTPVWLDETNDISCGGQPGVSDTYATALWALDLLTRTLKASFVGAAFHGFIERPTGYTPLAALSPAALAAGQLTAQPEWYALLLAHEVEGDRPLPVKLSPTGLNVATWAGRSPGGALQVIVDNEQSPGSRPLLVQLPGNGAGSASVLRLTGTALTATTGVSLGGNDVSPAGTWQKMSIAPRGPGADGPFRFSVPPISAVLVDVD
jgi:hypothetical protein